MPSSLTNLPIAITGASAGIGRATALACARAGMPVVLGARREDKLQAVAEEIRAAGGQATTYVMDVASTHDCERMVDVCVETYGSIYSVFANAGYGFEQPFAETPDEDIRKIFEVNFWGTINTIRPALPHMQQAGRGHVLINSSVIGILPTPFYGPYCATKAAQHHIGRAMNLELEPDGIHTSTVHPVWTKTEFADVVRDNSGGGSMSDSKPSFLIQSPDTVAKAVVKCLRKPRSEVWTSRTARFGAAMFVAFPGLADMIFRRMVKKAREAE